jgi:hypothetical protein
VKKTLLFLAVVAMLLTATNLPTVAQQNEPICPPLVKCQ